MTETNLEYQLLGCKAFRLLHLATFSIQEYLCEITFLHDLRISAVADSSELFFSNHTDLLESMALVGDESMSFFLMIKWEGTLAKIDKNDRYPLWFKALDVIHLLFRAPNYQIKGTCTDKFNHLPKMDYVGCRNKQISNGDLLFCGGNYTFSKIIRYLSGRSKVSHVGIVYWWNDRLMLLESVETDGVRIVPVSQYLENYENSGKPYDGRVYLARHKNLYLDPKNDAVAACTVCNPKVEQLLKKSATLLNKKFSLWDTFYFFKQGLIGGQRYIDNDEYLCSEFVAKCFKEIDIQFKDDGYGFVAPEHIAAAEEVEVLYEIVPCNMTNRIEQNEVPR